MAGNDVVTASDLDYLRKDSLRTVLICLSLALYFWCVTLLQTGTWFGAAWWGPILPVVVLFFFAQRAFVEGITLTGMKG